MNPIRYLRSRMTMELIVPYLFYDFVAGRWVHAYRDRYGVEWMAFTKWGYRVRRNKKHSPSRRRIC